MSRPRLLDAFCGAGGCSVGYARAGFDVVGIDVAPMPAYPYFDLILGDVGGVTTDVVRDGTYVARGPDINLPRVLAWLRELDRQIALDDPERTSA